MKKDLRYAGGLWHMAVFVLNLFFSKNGGNVEAMELLLKLESVVPGDMTFESCSNDGWPRDGDNGLSV